MNILNLNRNNVNLFCYIVCFLTLSSIGCKKENNQGRAISATSVTGPYLYVGGSTTSGGFYWKTSLSQSVAHFTTDTISGAGRINAIVTLGSDVYITSQAAGYWKNNTFVPITGASSIFYLALSGNNVYTAGYDNTASLAYWINNAETNLGNTIGRNLFPYQGVATYGLSGIAVSGSNALVTGSLFFENEPFTPDTARSGNFGLLWTNGSVHLFGQGYFITSFYNNTAGVVVSGNDIYVAGVIPDYTRAGGYWKNGVWSSINNGGFYPASITSSGSDVYISGYTYTRTPSFSQLGGAYWKNGQLFNFSAASTIIAVAVNGTDMYVLGVDYNRNNVVWKNGTVFETLGSTATESATCMTVGN